MISISILCSLALGASSGTAADSLPVSEFDAFRCNLAGHWDNVAQASADAAAGADYANLHPRRAMTYVPVTNPDLEGQLFAIRNFTEQGFSGPISRVSLHRFRPEGDTIVHEFMFLLDKERWGDLSQDLEALTRITEADVRINRDCAMYWRSAGDHFEGATIKGQCVTSSFTPEPILVEGHGELYRDRLIRHDQNFSLSGEPLPVPGGATPERFDKIDDNELPEIACAPLD